MPGGFIGVDIFFVISGYLISTILFKTLNNGSFSFLDFYGRRIRRIFPSLIVVLAACFGIGWFVLLTDEYKQLGMHMAAGAGFVSNLVLWGEAGYFDNSAETKPLLHLWSLGIEEQFYIVWPLFLYIVWKRNYNLLTLTAFITITSFYLNINGVDKDLVTTFYLPQTRMWELLSGSLLAWFILNRNAFDGCRRCLEGLLVSAFYHKQNRIHESILPNALSIIGSLMLAYGFIFISKELRFPGWFALIPTLATIFLIASGPHAIVNRAILSNKLLVWVGLISFPLYLWHWPLLTFARIIEGTTPDLNIRIFAVLLSIALAWITYKLIECPVRLGKQEKLKTIILVFLLTIIGYVGFNIYERDGYPFRDSIKTYLNNKNELIRLPKKDETCINYLGINPLFGYCKFTNANSAETVAIIGDSHAHVAYPGIAEFNKNKGINTILLASSNCPSLIGIAAGHNDSEKEQCRLKTIQLINTVTDLKDVQKVLIFTRFSYYNTGTEPVKGAKVLNGGLTNNITLDAFFAAAQITAQILTKHGKSVFYISENPELNFNSGSCIARPFNQNAKNCSVTKSSVMARQGDYLKAFAGLKNVTFINSLKLFCPGEECIVFDENGLLLYADDDHLSLAGSRFQVRGLLKEYLD